jgi:hypothetical protein
MFFLRWSDLWLSEGLTSSIVPDNFNNLFNQDSYSLSYPISMNIHRLHESDFLFNYMTYYKVKLTISQQQQKNFVFFSLGSFYIENVGVFSW